MYCTLRMLGKPVDVSEIVIMQVYELLRNFFVRIMHTTLFPTPFKNIKKLGFLDLKKIYGG